MGGVRALGCGVLTGLVATAVLAYAFLPIGDGSKQLALGEIVGLLPGGYLIPFGISLVPAGAWSLVARVHSRRTRLGRFYAVLYCVLVSLCSIVTSAIAVGVCFPKQARFVLLKVLEWIPEDGASAETAVGGTARAISRQRVLEGSDT